MAGKSSASTGCTAIIILVGAFWLFSQCNGKGGTPGSPPAPRVATNTEAWVMAQQFVEQRLKAPGSADWPWYDGSFVKDLGGGRFRVTAYVDAQNSFGAKLRNHFTAELMYHGDERWGLVSCEFYGP